jgi:hypothetical protein
MDEDSVLKRDHQRGTMSVYWTASQTAYKMAANEI